MWIFYICALIPITIGGVLLWKDEQINWIEWLIGTAVAFLMAGIFHMTAIWGMTGDIETWSGEITKVSHYPRWVEEYQERHEETYYTGSGNKRVAHTRVWYTTEHDTHYEHWEATRNFGSYSDEAEIDQGQFHEIARRFGNHIVNDGTQSFNHFGGSFDGGDRNIYSAHDETGYLFPVTTTKSFENKIKAAPSVFSFTKVPTNIFVHPWPNNPDWMHSGRLLGTASMFIDSYKWDCMNALLGPMKRVNVIMIGFEDEPADYAHYQQAAWIGGKKNDLVICFGGGNSSKPAEWSYVFGWTEKEIVKKNLQTILLQHPINNNLLPLIADEINKNYTIKDWHKFDYITIEPPMWSYWAYFLGMIIVQGGLYFYFHSNEYDKNSVAGNYGRRYRRGFPNYF